MTRHHPSDPRTALLQHRWLNRLQTGLLVLTLVGIAAAAGRLPFGEGCLWLALFAVAGALLLEPVAASALSLRLYRVRALHPQEAHKMWALLRELPARAGLPATPVPHYVPSAVVNAFATGIEAGGIDRPHRWPAAQPEPTRAGDPQGLASVLAKIERVSRSWRAWLWPGWGNPEHSCLRTRPATQERIARLLTLAPGPASALPLRAPHFLPESALATRPPRWRPSGLWR